MRCSNDSPANCATKSQNLSGVAGVRARPFTRTCFGTWGCPWWWGLAATTTTGARWRRPGSTCAGSRTSAATRRPSGRPCRCARALGRDELEVDARRFNKKIFLPTIMARPTRSRPIRSPAHCHGSLVTGCELVHTPGAGESATESLTSTRRPECARAASFAGTAIRRHRRLRMLRRRSLGALAFETARLQNRERAAASFT